MKFALIYAAFIQPAAPAEYTALNLRGGSSIFLRLECIEGASDIMDAAKRAACRPAEVFLNAIVHPDDEEVGEDVADWFTGYESVFELVHTGRVPNSHRETESRVRQARAQREAEEVRRTAERARQADGGYPAPGFGGAIVVASPGGVSGAILREMTRPHVLIASPSDFRTFSQRLTPGQ